MNPSPERRRPHRFSEGRPRAFDADAPAGFDLDIDLDPRALQLVDPVDSHVLTDLLDRGAYVPETVDLEALLDVGLAYLAIGRHEQAADAFGRLCWFAPEGSRTAQEAWTNRGVAHAGLGEYDEACGAFAAAIDLAVDPELTAVAETNLADALWAMGDSSAPLDHAERAVEVDPRNPHAWYNLGYFYAERGLWSFAVEALDNALALGLRASWVHEERARALWALDENRAAERSDERARAGRAADERRLLRQ